MNAPLDLQRPAGNGLSDAPRRAWAIAAIVLAAGSASRMGGRPKGLLQLDGTPLVRRQVLALLDAGVDNVLVVLGHYADRVIPALQDLPVSFVRNPDPDAGQVASLRTGLRALPQRAEAVLVALADQPLVEARDIGDLVDVYAKRPTGVQVVQPSVDGLPGNPVMFTRAVRDQILAGDDGIGCRQWQAANPAQVLRWATHNSAYRTDLDTPEDIQAFEHRTGRQLSWPPGVHEAA